MPPSHGTVTRRAPAPERKQPTLPPKIPAAPIVHRQAAFPVARAAGSIRPAPTCSGHHDPPLTPSFACNSRPGSRSLTLPFVLQDGPSRASGLRLTDASGEDCGGASAGGDAVGGGFAGGPCWRAEAIVRLAPRGPEPAIAPSRLRFALDCCYAPQAPLWRTDWTSLVWGRCGLACWAPVVSAACELGVFQRYCG